MLGHLDESSILAKCTQQYYTGLDTTVANEKDLKSSKMSKENDDPGYRSEYFKHCILILGVTISNGSF